MSRPEHEFGVGSKVTVITTLSDSPHLACHPHTVVAEVVEQPSGPGYYVEHIEPRYAPRKFGPFPVDKLRRGWT